MIVSPQKGRVLGSRKNRVLLQSGRRTNVDRQEHRRWCHKKVANGGRSRSHDELHLVGFVIVWLSWRSTAFGRCGGGDGGSGVYAQNPHRQFAPNVAKSRRLVRFIVADVLDRVRERNNTATGPATLSRMENGPTDSDHRSSIAGKSNSKLLEVQFSEL